MTETKRGGARPGSGHKPGTPGTPRPTAGRKPQSWRLKQGDVIFINTYATSAIVNVKSRNELTLYLRDGSEIELIRAGEVTQ